MCARAARLTARRACSMLAREPLAASARRYYTVDQTTGKAGEKRMVLTFNGKVRCRRLAHALPPAQPGVTDATRRSAAVAAACGAARRGQHGVSGWRLRGRAQGGGRVWHKGRLGRWKQQSVRNACWQAAVHACVILVKLHCVVCNIFAATYHRRCIFKASA
jgi:hypothetical protein